MRVIALPAQHVGQRVDARCAVKKEGRADEEAPDQHLQRRGAEQREKRLQKPAPTEHDDSEENRSDQVEAVEKNQFGKLREIFDPRVVSREIATAGDPADVRPEEALHAGRMNILFLVRVLVMMPMHPRPPERTALRAGQAEEGGDELSDPRNLERLVAEIPVVKTGDEEHPREVKKHRRGHRDPTPPGPDNPEAAEVQNDEGNQTPPLHALGLIADHFRVALEIIAVEAVDDPAER